MNVLSSCVLGSGRSIDSDKKKWKIKKSVKQVISRNGASTERKKRRAIFASEEEEFEMGGWTNFLIKYLVEVFDD